MCLQQMRAKTNSSVKIVMLIHTNNGLFQNHIAFFNRGSSDSKVRNAAYISGIPAPGRNSALCSITTLKQTVGTSFSVNPQKFILKFCVSDGIAS